MGQSQFQTEYHSQPSRFEWEPVPQTTCKSFEQNVDIISGTGIATVHVPAAFIIVCPSEAALQGRKPLKNS